MTPQRADRSGWRRRAKSEDRWEQVLTLANCTAGEIWDALQKRVFLTVPPDAECDREWEFAVTLAGQRPEDAPVREPRTRTNSYMDRMMRAQGK